MSSVPHPANAGLSPEEYLRRERLAPERSEYQGPGLVVAMAGAGRKHNQIVMNISVELRNQLRDRDCNNYANDLRVRTANGRYFYPDVVVACGEEQYADAELDTLLNPKLVIEVVSPSTEGYDHGQRFLDYQSIPSLLEYVLISPETKRIEVFRRQADDSWRYESYPFLPPPVALHSVGCTLSPEEVFRKVDLNDSREA